MKKILILLCIIFLTSGCFNYTEINDLVIISGMLIDYNNNNYEVTSQIIENDNKTMVKTYKAKCSKLDECIFEISKYSNKDIFLSHLKIIILTENVITSNENYYDYFLRDPRFKMNFNVYYIDNKYKDDILNMYKENDGSALYIQELMKYNNKIFSSSTPVSFLDLIYKKLEYGIDPIYPNLKISNISNEKVLYLENLIAFNSENKKIVLDDIEGITYNIITNKLNKTILSIPCENGSFSLVINNAKTKYKLNSSILTITTDLKTNISSYTCTYDLSKPKTIKILNNYTNEYIQKNINDLIEIQNKYNVDFLGFRSYVYKHSKKRKDLNNIVVKIKVNTIINSIGEIKNEARKNK